MLEQLFEEKSVKSGSSKQLPHAGQLKSEADKLAMSLLNHLMKDVDDEERAAAEEILTKGDTASLINLFTESGLDLEPCNETVADASNDELKRLLESRRSDRSKRKKAGHMSSVQNLLGFCSAMFAEMSIRQALNQPYAASTVTTSELDTEDLDAVNRKIRSLQSKQSRVRKLADYDEQAAAELSAVQSEIARLKDFRPKSAGSAVIKTPTIEDLRSYISAMTEDQVEQLLEMLEQ